MEEDLEGSSELYNFPKVVSTPNVLKRTYYDEIRARSEVIGVFFSIDSYLRQVTAFLIEHTKDWINKYVYI